ncbi:amidohydrolase family protein [Pseudonocardia ailaonensis]|uniref:Amidohydrolase family protein n=1 Tax=Pseudonocardia ailaonensis TaxID=367279 RepID=A0ABN2MHY9_9PSEU
MTAERALIVSSDGHATARMPEYGQYIPERSREEFEAFVVQYAKFGSKNFEARALAARLDPEAVDDWQARFIDTGRLDGNSDPAKRLEEMAAEGVSAEVLIPDFGTPFEMLSPTASGAMGQDADTRTPQQIADSCFAFNRWLADFVSYAPERFAGMAKIDFDDVEFALKEIAWAHEAGLRGIMVPHMRDDFPVYHPDFDPIWALVSDLGMVVDCHSGMSSITRRRPAIPRSAPHPSVVAPILTREFMFAAQQLLVHFIWGGVLERHPRLKVVFTEMGSAWAAPALAGMDYSFEGSYTRHDTREVLTMKPSEYFTRQVWLGSSIFSRAEVAARNELVGPAKMMLGMDFPHHEGTLATGPGTLGYLRATVGAAGVPADEARLMLGESALDVFGLDRAALSAVAAEVGPELDLVLTAPEVDEYPRGDVKKPLVYV